MCALYVRTCLQLPCVSGPASPSLSSASQGDSPCGEDYRRLLKCLALEQWKAGGCFQHFLERQGADTEVGAGVGVRVACRYGGAVCGDVVLHCIMHCLLLLHRSLCSLFPPSLLSFSLPLPFSLPLSPPLSLSPSHSLFPTPSLSPFLPPFSPPSVVPPLSGLLA